MTERKITFPIVGKRGEQTVRRNLETGVEIVNNGRDFAVYAPALRNQGRPLLINYFETLAGAREEALDRAHDLRAQTAAAYAAAVAEDAHREGLAICASIPADGRPSVVTDLLTAAELLTDEYEHLAAVRHARAVYDECLAGAQQNAVITFERIGRHREPAATLLPVPRTLLTGAPDDLAAAVHRHARKFVNSKSFDVTVDLATGSVLIEEGRFGRGSFVPAPISLPEIERQGDYYAGLPKPRAERLAVAFERFVELADSGGPGTAKGLKAAVESATTITPTELATAIDAAGIPSASLTAIDVLRMVESLGFIVN